MTRRTLSKWARSMASIPAQPREMIFVDEQKLITAYVSPGQRINPAKYLKRHGIKTIKK